MEMTEKQLAAIEVLAAGVDYNEASLLTGTPIGELVKWRKDPMFLEEVNRRSASTAYQAFSLLKGATYKCVQVLLRTLDEALASEEPIHPAVQKTALAVIDRVAGVGGVVVNATTGGNEGSQIQINFVSKGDEDVDS